MEKWVIEERQWYTWNLFEKIDGTTYRLNCYVDATEKTVKFWFGMTSGKKRSDLDIYENKEYKAKGGLKALVWAIKEIHNFPELYRKSHPQHSNLQSYLCIKWADSRRRQIYSRLERYGFKFMHDRGELILMKKL